MSSGTRMYDREGRLRAIIGGGRGVFLDPQQLEHTRVQRHMYYAEWVEELPTAGGRDHAQVFPDVISKTYKSLFGVGGSVCAQPPNKKPELPTTVKVCPYLPSGRSRSLELFCEM